MSFCCFDVSGWVFVGWVFILLLCCYYFLLVCAVLDA